jgi:hypothetical protein
MAEGSTSQEKALHFIRTNLGVFWQPDSSTVSAPVPTFRFWMERSGDVILNLYSQGVRVFQGEFTVGFGKDGNIHEAGGTLRILTNIDTEPTLTSADALEIVAKSEMYNAPGQKVPEEAELVIVPASPPRLMYSIFVTLGPHVLVDAKTGEIIPGLFGGPSTYPR